MFARLGVSTAAAVLATAFPAAADRGEPGPEVPQQLQRNGCVTWAEFNEVPMEDGSKVWGKRRIERVWGARGIYNAEYSIEGTLSYFYQRCDRVGYGVQVVYGDQRGKPWLAKTFPCPCPGAKR